MLDGQDWYFCAALAWVGMGIYLIGHKSIYCTQQLGHLHHLDFDTEINHLNLFCQRSENSQSQEGRGKNSVIGKVNYSMFNVFGKR